MKLFDGKDNKDVQFNCIYDNSTQALSNTTTSIIQIVDRNQFKNFYKKNRMKFKGLVSPFDPDVKHQDSDKAKLVTSDVDIYMMAMNGLMTQESYYHLLDGSSIVGQVKINFSLDSSNLSNQKQSFLHPEVSESEDTNECARGRFTSINLYRTQNSNPEVDEQ